MKRLLAIAVIGTALGASGAGATGPITLRCKGGALTGSFRAVRGSPGAGGISYALRLLNTSHTTCLVTGIPVVQLLDRQGKRLPTHASAAYPGEATAVIVILRPGKTAISTARFSPDVPGPGEGHPGACEATSYKLRVTPGGRGSVVVPISPPTAVCSHGAMRFSVLTAA